MRLNRPLFETKIGCKIESGVCTWLQFMLSRSDASGSCSSRGTRLDDIDMRDAAPSSGHAAGEVRGTSAAAETVAGDKTLSSISSGEFSVRRAETEGNDWSVFVWVLPCADKPRSIDKSLSWGEVEAAEAPGDADKTRDTLTKRRVTDLIRWECVRASA